MITIVSGFGRCGSSLLMQMLQAGGMPCAGEFPAFEPEQSREHLGGGSISAEWLASIPGHAVKILDPQNGTIPRVDCRVIWCSRDYHEQAMSQAKFAHILLGFPSNRATVRGFERSYVADKPSAVKSLLATGTPSILEVRFEHVLSIPRSKAREISDYCGGLDVEAMAKAVRQRDWRCASGLDLELSLIQESR